MGHGSPFYDAFVHLFTQLVCHLLLDHLYDTLMQTIHCQLLGASIEISLYESRHQHS